MMHRYPFHMVPYIGLNPKIKVDDLKKWGSFAIARRVDKTFSEKDIIILPDGTGIVRIDSSLREEVFERVPFLSVTLLRQAYPISYAKYDLSMKPKTDDWDGGLVKPWLYKGKAATVKNCFLMVYKGENIHAQPAKYQRRFESKSDAESVEEYYEDLKNDIVANAFSTKKFYKGIGSIILNHTPTMLNYWHFELRLINSEDNLIRSVKYKPHNNPRTMNMKQSFVEYVIETFLFKFFWVDTNPCKEDIPSSCFNNKEISILRRKAANLMNRCLYLLIPIVVER